MKFSAALSLPFLLSLFNLECRLLVLGSRPGGHNPLRTSSAAHVVRILAMSSLWLPACLAAPDQLCCFAGNLLKLNSTLVSGGCVCGPPRDLKQNAPSRLIYSVGRVPPVTYRPLSPFSPSAGNEPETC
jgi:hypothetical protein